MSKGNISALTWDTKQEFVLKVIEVIDLDTVLEGTSDDCPIIQYILKFATKEFAYEKVKIHIDCCGPTY